jgi:glyoxylase-like metal-dependent hydrolase (beta-lactamase superfamily II)
MTALEHRRREPAPGVFRLVLPLPFPGLTKVNAYLLMSEDGCVLVDCGLQDPSNEEEEGWVDVVEALGACDVAPDQVTTLIVTHPHVDHYGMAGKFVEVTGCELWMHEASGEDLYIYRDPQSSVRALRSMLADHGVGEREIEELTAFENWRSFVYSVIEPSKTLKGGESFDAGERTWEIVHTPGHSRSHVCLWSESDGIFVSGDHLLPAITPHIDFRRGMDDDPLGDYLDSLGRVEELDPKLVLPGHGRPFEEGAERARVTARHHDRRLGAILQVIRKEAKSADQITDEIFGRTLLNFQRRLAVGEALAHLAYLRARGEIERVTNDDGVYLYRKARKRRAAGDDA